MISKTQTIFKETEIGFIPAEWEVAKIVDVTEKVAIGPFDSSIKVETFVNDGMPVISGQHLHGIKLEDRDYNFITMDHAEKLRNSIVLRGDVVFTHAGNIGQVAYIPNTSKYDHYIISQRQFYLRCDKTKLTPDFITYFFKTAVGQHILLSNKSQTGVPSIAQPVTHLRNIEVPVPSLNEQQRISEILSSLDDKIELNRQINANLEKLASSIFKHWFVDFEFPDEDGKPYKSSGGKMFKSALGEIPEGWSVSTLFSIADITIGRTPPRMQAQWFSEDPEDIKWISIKDMGPVGVYINKTAEYLTREAVEQFNIPVIPINTVVVSFKLTVGRVAITTEKMLSNEAIAHVRLINKTIPTEYIYFFLKSFDYSSLGSTSSIATAVNSKSIKEIPVLIPDDKVMANFAKVVGPIFKFVFEYAKQIEELTQLRDSLLPRLMSGKIRTA